MAGTFTPPPDPQNCLCLPVLLNMGLLSFVPTAHTLVLSTDLSHRDDQNKPGIRVCPIWPFLNQFLPRYQNDLSKNMYIYLISTLPSLMVPFALRIMGWPASKNPSVSGSRLPLTCLTHVKPYLATSAPQSLNLPHLLPSLMFASGPFPSGFRIFSASQRRGPPVCSQQRVSPSPAPQRRSTPHC